VRGVVEYYSNMCSIRVPAELAAKLAALDTAVAAIGQLNFDRLEASVRLHALERLETSRRRQIAVGHDGMSVNCHRE
jgi:hypothetical protein